MKIAVIGSGAIGSLIGGYLKVKGSDVVLVGHADSVRAIKEHGLKISGVRGDFNVDIAVSERLEFTPDIAILAVKTQDIAPALEDNLAHLGRCVLITTQNGVRCDEIAAGYLARKNIISSIVMFGATYLEPAKVVHNFEGAWALGSVFKERNEKIAMISSFLNNIFPASTAEDIKGMKYLKIFVNANNCIPAILGLSMQESFSDISTSHISMQIWREGLEVINKSGIKLVSLPDFSLEKLTKLTSLPAQESAKIFSGIMINLSKEPLYGSILQSIKRARTSEIDFINGEFVRLAQDFGMSVPLNEKLVEMVHQVERTGKFFSRQDLLKNTEGLYN